MILQHTWGLLKKTWAGWTEDKAPRLAAALAYYSIFSMAPLLIIVIAVAGLVFGEEAARGEIVTQVSGTIGPQAARTLEEMVQHAGEHEGGIAAVVIGIVVLVIGASGVFVQLQDALNTIWRVQPKPGRGVWGMVRERILSFSVILGTGFLLLVSLVISATLAALGKFLSADALPGGTILWQLINLGVSLAIITLLFAMIFKLLPDVKLAWRDVWIGALATALLFTLGKFVLGIYLGQSSVASAYGAAGALVVLLLWVYYSSLILLFGAEFTKVFAESFGSAVTPKANAEPISVEVRAEEGMTTSEKRAQDEGKQKSGALIMAASRNRGR